MVDVRPTLSAPDEDPYLWLEEVEGERAVAWVDAQTERTRERIADERWAADRDALAALLDRPDNLPIPTRRGGLLYNYWTDAAQPRGVWRRTTMESFLTGAPTWEVLLDLDALAAAEGVEWVWHGATTLAPGHERAVISLSRGGSDAAELREFDLGARSFVAGGFRLEASKGGADWVDRDTLLLSSALGGETASGYPSTIRLWRRGGAPLEGEALFAIEKTHMGVWGGVDRVGGRLVFSDKPGFFDTVVWLGDAAGGRQKLDVPSDAWASWEGDWLAVRTRTAWTVAGRVLAPDTVVVTSLAGFLRGERELAVVFEPGERRALQSFFWSAGRLILHVLDEMRPVFITHAAPEWAPVAIGGLPGLGTVNVWPLDREEDEADGTLLANVQDPVTPSTLMLIPPLGAPTVLRRVPAGFDATGLVVTRHEAVSSDGERIPYVQTGPEGLTGEAPVHLGGYGGFGISRLPGYGLGIGKLWLERGGTSVVANIRGGGEFGTRWHEAGRLAGKRLSHDDFAAVAADLVRRGVTRPGRIAAEGGSNGGLLIANMLTRYPERFGALFCTIPLIDMRRYHRLLAGASWMAEYGDPGTGDWAAFLGAMSAYHVAEPGRAYPPILLATTRRDDRVHPGHARKMAAKLQALGYDALFYEPAAGGHGFGTTHAEVAGFAALGYAFLRRAIGWESA